MLGSDQAGKQTQLVAPGFEDVREGDADVPLEKLQDLFEDFARRWDWVWKESAEGDRSLALQLFKSPETFQRLLPSYDTRLCSSTHLTTNRTTSLQRVHAVRKAVTPLCAPQEAAKYLCPFDELQPMMLAFAVMTDFLSSMYLLFSQLILFSFSERLRQNFVRTEIVTWTIDSTYRAWARAIGASSKKGRFLHKELSSDSYLFCAH